MTTSGNIRLRYVGALVGVLVIGGLYIVNKDDTQNVPTPSVIIEEQIAEEATQDKALSITPQSVHSETAPQVEAQKIVDIKNYDPEQSGLGMAPFLSRIGTRPYFDEPYAWEKTINVDKGDTLGQLIEDAGLTGDDYRGAMAALKEHVDPRSIKTSHKIIVNNVRTGNEDVMASLAYVYDGLKSVVLVKKDDKWIAENKEVPLEVKTNAARAKIESSIYGSMGKVGIPDGIINRMIKAYSWTVDFQRDIWGDEEVEVLYETKESEDGEYVRSNRLLYANLKLRNRDMPIFLYEKEKGFFNYFEPSGQSIRRALMRTPIDGARLSSGYGMRTHPVLGYRKAHKGVDFAAPTGTPIYAAGDGVVERANRFGSYGNYIKIRHNKTYKTAYAHLHGFAKGIRAGTRVKQGQVIGYVGSTGRSTGPHLHYEVHKNGVKVNPHSVDLPLGEQLKGEQLKKFQKFVKQRLSEFSNLTGLEPLRMAQKITLPMRKPSSDAR